MLGVRLMGALLGLGGLGGVIVSLVIIVINAINKRPKKKAVIALAICFALFVVALALPSGNEADKSAQTEEPVERESSVQIEEPIYGENSAQTEELAEGEESVQTEQPAEEEEYAQTEEQSHDEQSSQADKSVVYVEDEVVNQFMIDYDRITNSPIENISKGNIRTKYYFETYGFSVEIINATNVEAGYTSVSINGNMDSHVPEMREVFHDVVKTLDPGLSDEEIYSFFDEGTVYGNCAHESPLGKLICSVYLNGNFDGNGRIDIHN